MKKYFSSCSGFDRDDFVEGRKAVDRVCKYFLGHSTFDQSCRYWIHAILEDVGWLGVSRSLLAERLGSISYHELIKGKKVGRQNSLNLSIVSL